MDLQKFKQTYKKVISESTDEIEIKNYIRSIVEEVLVEAKTSVNDVNAKIENIMAEKGWKNVSSTTKYIFQKNNREVSISNDGEDLGWAYGEIGKKYSESGNDPINLGMKEVKRLAGMRILNSIK